MRSRAATAERATHPGTRDLILDTAEHLIAKKGVFGFVLKDIADPLGFRVPAIYKHYKSRDDVLIEVARRFIARLSEQFRYPPEALAQPAAALKKIIVEFVRFHIVHPAYVRLSLTDFATPQGGMEYIRLAAGGAFRENFSRGPLASMHGRLRDLLHAGRRLGEFQARSELELYRLIKSSLLIRLVFPDDLLVERPTPASARAIEKELLDIAFRFVAHQDQRPSSSQSPGTAPSRAVERGQP